MAIKLYSLRNVPDDEADEMRELLRNHEIDFHETTAGFLGIGTAAIWINDAAQHSAAKALIAEYQSQRYKRAREDYLALKARGEHIDFLDRFWQNPGKISAYILLALFLIFLTTLPFFI